jgi:hypothetical protein
MLRVHCDNKPKTNLNTLTPNKNRNFGVNKRKNNAIVIGINKRVDLHLEVNAKNKRK